MAAASDYFTRCKQYYLFAMRKKNNLNNNNNNNYLMVPQFGHVI